MSEELCVDFSSSFSGEAENFGAGKSGSYRTGEKNPGYAEARKSGGAEYLKIGYRRDLNAAYFVVETEHFYQPDYQMKMIAENDIFGILKMKGRGINGRSRYEYEIQGKHSLEFLTKKGPVTYDMIIGIIRDLLHTVEEMREYLLNPNQLLLEPRSIFSDTGQYYFCYLPVNEKGISESFHELTEFFVKETDYQDRSGIYISYALHKMTLQENYQIRQVIEEILTHQEEELGEKEYEEDVEDWEEDEDEYDEYEDDADDDEYGTDDDEPYEDWGLEEKTLRETVREKLSGWERFKNFVYRRKRENYGEILKDGGEKEYGKNY